MKEDFDHDGQADWYKVINYFKSKLIGFVWGGDFKSIKDHPHFEKTFGNSWQRLLEKHHRKDFIDGDDYIKK